MADKTPLERARELQQRARDNVDRMMEETRKANEPVKPLPAPTLQQCIDGNIDTRCGDILSEAKRTHINSQLAAICRDPNNNAGLGYFDCMSKIQSCGNDLVRDVTIPYLGSFVAPVTSINKAGACIKQNLQSAR